MSDQAGKAEVLFENRGALGLIVLNRPQVINALTHGMVGEISRRLDAWAVDTDVKTVALTGSGERGLCAGGDIVSLYRDATEGDGIASLAFWRDEYELDAQIARYPKPYVALMDGLVLGGGIGLSAHASHRIVTEHSKLGLPETGIGFVPDVGASWLLSRAPGELGTYLALTAGSIGAGDAIAVGLADVYVPSARLPLLLADLERADASAVLGRHAVPAPASELLVNRSWIDASFSADSVSEIVARLRSAGWNSVEAADTIEAKSPVALAVALESLRRAALLPTLEAALEQEFRVSAHALRTADFAEGVRAQVIDKDRNPAWRPPSSDEVTPQMVEAYFESAPSATPSFPTTSN
jgi:enoyl-CoA hydratase